MENVVEYEFPIPSRTTLASTPVASVKYYRGNHRHILHLYLYSNWHLITFYQTLATFDLAFW